KVRKVARSGVEPELRAAILATIAWWAWLGCGSAAGYHASRSMTSRGEYWDEEIENMPAAARPRLEGPRPRRQIAYNYRSSAYYRAKLDGAGVAPSDIRDVADLARIPFMKKRELAASQEDGTLLGINQCAPLEEIVRIQATGGTTGQPLRIGWTRQ